ncbi:hypothetical protein SI65_04224 [Aspergillus cristatus]|uniref:Uncharacterized protein n=1 Tax=Aspergillus cristatus TaxID=573508 RepID=A0A1E3BK65_ASPCR|nr:hypothetical protein SI65_04224 [Aspergillus cristatus]
MSRASGQKYALLKRIKEARSELEENKLITFKGIDKTLAKSAIEALGGDRELEKIKIRSEFDKKEFIRGELNFFTEEESDCLELDGDTQFGNFAGDYEGSVKLPDA